MRLADAELPAHFVAFLGLDEPGEAEAVQTTEDEALKSPSGIVRGGSRLRIKGKGTNVVVDGGVVCQGWVFEACLGLAEEEAWTAPCHHAFVVSIQLFG